MKLPVEAIGSPELLSTDDVFVIDATIAAQWFDVAELWRFRELIWILTLRDIQVRYRQALVGLAWVVLQPLAQMLVFNVFFKLIRPVDGTVSYESSMVSILCGLALWQLFASILLGSTNCLVDNRQLITKVYFPRVVLPLSATFRPLIDFFVVLGVLLAFLGFWQTWPGIAILGLPLVVLGTMVLGFSFGLWLSALNAHYRDFGHIVPFVLQIGFFVSPVIVETSNVIPQKWQLLYAINPMSCLLGAFRGCVLGTPWPTLSQGMISSAVAVVVLTSGAWYFHRVERFLADRL